MSHIDLEYRKHETRTTWRRCKHEHAFICSDGGRHFDPETGVWDNIRQYYYCPDCGKEIPNK